MTIRSWIASLTALAEQHGATIEHTRGSHLAIRLPNGGTVHAASTPSDGRAYQNVRANLRRLAASPPPKRKP